MHAKTVLQTCLAPALEQIHARRAHALLGAVTALIMGRRLVLMDLARSWPGAERVRAPLKCLDRLLSNRALHLERRLFYALICRWLSRSNQLLVLVDWSDLKRDGSWHLLRAAVPVGGRSVTIYEAVYSESEKATPYVEKAFLVTLKSLLPAHVTPIIVTDAGFRGPWFRSVEALGWHWLGRVRNTTLVLSKHKAGAAAGWVSCKTLYSSATTSARDLGAFDVARSHPLPCRLVVLRKAPRGRKHRTRRGAVAANSNSRVNAKREQEPWLLAASHSLDTLKANQVVAIYAKRMQIELAFRDMKSHRYGCAFEDSLTRKGHRLEILLLIHALAGFAAWLVGLTSAAVGQMLRLAPSGTAQRSGYSLLRLGWEALRRDWLRDSDRALRETIRRPPPELAATWCLT